MEGETCSTNKLRFIESKRKYKLDQLDQSASIKLVTAANNHDLILFARQQSVLGLSMSQMFDFDRSKKTEIFNANQFSLSLPLSFRPTMLTVARYGYSSTLLVSGLNHMNVISIEAFDLDTRTSIGRLDLNELGNQSEVIDYSWHPNYFESIVALCTRTGNLLVLAIDRPKKAISLALNLANYGALTCAWSPKGKNLAVGRDNGSIIRLEPIVDANNFSFKEVDRSIISFVPHPKITSGHRVTRLRWLNKTYLICVHAQLGNCPETVHSIITVKPNKPHLYWTNICLENQNNIADYVIYMVNLSNSALCTSSVSGEAAVIGVNGLEEVNRGDLKDYKNFIIDEEGARIELPLDAASHETYPKGVTATFIKSSPNDANGKPVLIFLTTDGLMCAYLMDHVENIMRLPEFQKPADCPISIMPQAAASAPQTSPSQSIPSPPMPQSTFQTHSFGNSGLFNKGPAAGSGLYNPLAGLTGSSMPQSTFGSFGSATSGASTFGSLAGASTFGSSPFGASTFGSNQPLSFASVSTTSAPAPAQPSALNAFSATPLNAPSLGQATFTTQGFSNSISSAPATTPAPATTTDAFSKPALDLSTTPASTPIDPPPNQSNVFATKPTTDTDPSASTAPSSILAVSSQPLSTFSSSLSMGLSLSSKSEPAPTQIEQPKTTNQATDSITLKLPTNPSERAVTATVAPTPPSTLALSTTSLSSSQQALAPSAPIINQRKESVEKAHRDMSSIPKEIIKIKENIKYNEAFFTLLEDINHLRKQFKEVEESHNIHKECFEAIREDINQLDIGMLENLYLIEYIKSRKRDISRKKSLDPKTLKKVDNIKQKSKLLAEKLKDLNVNVDVSWEDFVRRRSASESRDRKINSLDIIYQTLATNQKIITALQRKVAPMQAAIEASSPQSNKKSSLDGPSSASKSFAEANCDRVSNRRDVAPAKMRAFREYLSSRNGVPVRRPELVTASKHRQ